MCIHELFGLFFKQRITCKILENDLETLVESDREREPQKPGYPEAEEDKTLSDLYHEVVKTN